MVAAKVTSLDDFNTDYEETSDGTDNSETENAKEDTDDSDNPKSPNKQCNTRNNSNKKTTTLQRKLFQSPKR